MNEDRSPFSEIKNKLGPFPLFHLIPKQDLFPLLSSNVVDPCSGEVSSKVIKSLKVLDDAKMLLEDNPTSLQEIVGIMGHEFSAFHDTELENIKFKDPCISKNNFDNPESSLELPALESAIYEKMAEVDEALLEKCSNSSLINKHYGKILDIFNAQNVRESGCEFSEFLSTEDTVQSSLEDASTGNIKDISFASSKRSSKELDWGSSPPRKISRSSFSMNNAFYESAYKSLESLVPALGSVVDNVDVGANLSNEEDLSADSLEKVLQIILQLGQHQSRESLDVPLLKRVQNTCLRSVMKANEIYWLDINEVDCALNQNEDAAMRKDVVGVVAKALLASRIIFLVLNNAGTNKELSAMEYSKVIVDFLCSLMQDFVMPIAVRSSSTSSDMNKLSYENMIRELCSLVDLISVYVSSEHISDYFMTRVEFLIISVLFAEVHQKEKTSIFGVSNFEALRSRFSLVLVLIFKFHETQRPFILSEILSNIEKIPTQRLVARQFKLARGFSIQVISFVLMSLVQCLASEGPLDALDMPDSGSVVSSSEINNRKMILERAATFAELTSGTAGDLAFFLVDKLEKSTDSQWKQTFEILLEDFISVLEFPEWAASEVILCAIFKCLISKLKSGSLNATVEAYAMELAGIVGVKIFGLRRRFILQNELASSGAETLLKLYNSFTRCLKYMHSNSLKNTYFIPAYKYLILRFINELTPFLKESCQDQNQLAALNSENDAVTSEKDTVIKASAILNELTSVFQSGSSTAQRDLYELHNSSIVDSYCFTLTFSELFPLFENFINTVLLLLDSNKVKSKTKAIRIISSLVDLDPNLLISPKVKEPIASKLLDPSPLVRDAIIDLVYRFILCKPEVIEQFYRPLCGRLLDESVQVRKRVLRIAKDMYTTTKSVEIKSEIALKVMRRQYDEDDLVSEISISYLLNLWFTTSGMSSSLEKAETGLKWKPLTSETTKVMMSIVGSSESSLRLLDSFLMNHVFAVRKSEFKESLGHIVGKCLDFVVDSVESRPDDDVERALIVMSLIAKYDGKLISQDHLIALQPLLIDERKSNNSVCFYSLQILKYALSDATALRSDFIVTVQSHLLKRLAKFGVKELHEAMPCVWIISSMGNDTIKLATACLSSMKLLKPMIEEFKNKQATHNQKTVRLLHLLGCFATYCKFEKHRDVFLNSQLGMKEKETVVSICMKFILFFTREGFHSAIRKAAIRNIICVCSVHPKLFMSDAILKILDQELASPDTDIKTCIIQGMNEFLSTEDLKLQRKNCAHLESSKNIGIDKAVFHGESSNANDGICAGLVQRYLKQALSMTLEDSGNISLIPVKFLQLIVQLGYANPKICIPYVIALQSTTNDYVKRIAHDLHMSLVEKHESLVEGSYLEGLKLAIKFRKATSRNIYKEDFFLSLLYSIVSKRYSSRKKLIHSISKIFNINLSLLKLEENTFQRDAIIFSAINLANVRFVSLEEVLIIVKQIDSVVSREGMNLADIISQETASRAAISLIQRRNTCVQCQAMVTLISLRNHLVATYNLTETQIENFLPNRVDLALRQMPKVVSIIPFSLETESINSALKNTDSFAKIHTKFIHSLHEFSL